MSRGRATSTNSARRGARNSTSTPAATLCAWRRAAAPFDLGSMSERQDIPRVGISAKQVPANAISIAPRTPSAALNLACRYQSVFLDLFHGALAGRHSRLALGPCNWGGAMIGELLSGDPEAVGPYRLLGRLGTGG